MKFSETLVKARLIKRYKRFLADVQLESGEVVTAHCANSGSMMGLKEPGVTVWLSPNTNPKAKLDWRWELVELDSSLVGINTSRPNAIVEEAIQLGKIAELVGYDHIKREVKYGQNSRIDILLTKEDSDQKCYVEVKNVTLKGEGDAANTALFPDAVTARGTKHLNELVDMVTIGHRAVMVYLVQRMDCTQFAPAQSIDPLYSDTLKSALNKGVEALCYQCKITRSEISVEKQLPIIV